MEDIVKQAQEMQKKMAKVQEEIAQKSVQASSGGGMVMVTVSGSLEVTDIQIDPTVVDGNEITMLQDLIMTAVNEGVKKARDMGQEEMSKVTGGLNIPGLSGLM
ncbi:MAG TPA: YbaB/EbfC family nucleoid-associated protein [Desulfohalobiaceae bacterium]|nr:YbaB/EbfC family nucleoid-associated protein [Desulfohalobiaceae bacterium]